MKKSKIVIVSLLAVVLLAVLILLFSGPDNLGYDAARSGEDPIVVINLTGTIQEGQGGFMGGAITPRLVQNLLTQAASDPSLAGVVLRVDSPGGSIAASQEIAAIIRDFDKPIVVSMADMAASGGYYIAAYAQGIVAQPGTMTGSIGVISTIMNLEGLYEMLGVEVETFKSGEHKDMFSRTPSEEERKIMQNISDQAYGQFVGDIAEGRGMSIEAVRQVATGELFLGSQAKDLGLVDRLGGVEEAIAYLAELNGLENPVRRELPQPSLFTQFFEFGYRVLSVVENGMLGSDLIKLKMLQEGIRPDIRYQVR